MYSGLNRKTEKLQIILTAEIYIVLTMCYNSIKITKGGLQYGQYFYVAGQD